MKKPGKILVITALVLILSSLCVFAEQEGDYTYELDSLGVKITRYTGTATEITIPAALGGYPVTTIGANAFRNSGVTSVIVSNGIKYIESFAFEYSKLTSITLPGSLAELSGGAASD